MLTPGTDGHTLRPPLSVLARQWWFLWPLALRLLAWIFLAHAYEIAVFQDASRQLAAGHGVYARFTPWLDAAGDGYYAAPPVYAYMLWISGRLSEALGGHWWIHQALIKAWLLLADLGVMTYLLHRSPAAARTYWTLWFVPVVAIGQVQPDLWAGLAVLAAYHLAGRERWWAVGILLGLGASVKPVPLILLPFLAVHLIRRGKAPAAGAVGLSALAGLAAGWLPYVLAFQDAARVADAVRFHAWRSIAGLTIPSGILILTNAGLTMLELAGITWAWANAAYTGALRAGAFFPFVTLAVFAVLLAFAVRGRPWTLAQTFLLPLLVFLAANKVVHEHYVLQALPLLVTLALDLRGLTVAFSVYVIAAGGPLRYLPSELGLPTSLEAVLPPLLGVGVSLGLAIAAGLAAVAFGLQVVRLVTGPPTASSR